MKWIPALLFITIVNSCTMDTEINLCDPKSGRFISGDHYLSSGILTENNTLDYKALLHYYVSKKNYYTEDGCMPIKVTPSLSENIKSISDDIDFNR